MFWERSSLSGVERSDLGAVLTEYRQLAVLLDLGRGSS